MATDPLDPTTWRLSTAGGIPYRILNVSGESEQDSSTATEVYLIPATQILNFIIESFPYPVVINGVSYYRNRRMPGLPAMTTRRIRWERFIDGLPIDPFQTDTQAPAKTYPNLARVTVEYSNERDKDENDEESFVEITGNVVGEFLHVALPKATTVNESAGPSSSGGVSGNQNTRTTLSAVKYVPGIEWTIRWDQIQRKFWKETLFPRLQAAMGKVNSAAWPLLFQTREGMQYEETLLFVGFSFEEVFHVNALIPNNPERETERDKEQREEQEQEEDAKLDPVKIEMKFLEKRIEELGDEDPVSGLREITSVYGHNHIWVESAPAGLTGDADDAIGWRKVYIAGQNRTLYDSYDFNDLFKSEKATED